MTYLTSENQPWTSCGDDSATLTELITKANRNKTGNVRVTTLKRVYAIIVAVEKQ
jgi:hypothetical protein